MNAIVAADFTLHRHAEVLAIVERLHRERVLATVEFARGHAIVSSVLEVRRDAHAMVIDVARDPEQNERLFASGSLEFIAQLDSVQIAFETGAPTPVSMGDGPAALVALPDAVVRLQRREAFRALLPRQPPVRCTILDDVGNAVPAEAIDVSVTGTALMAEDVDGSALPGSVRELVLSLPEVGRIEIDATLRSVTATGGPSARVRMGFRFESLPRPIAQRLQRYVQHLEVHQMRILSGRKS